MIISDDRVVEQAPPTKYPRFSRLLKAARKSKRISAFEMADLLGVNYKAYFALENGRELPDDDTLVKINRVLFG